MWAEDFWVEFHPGSALRHHWRICAWKSCAHVRHEADSAPAWALTHREFEVGLTNVAIEKKRKQNAFKFTFKSLLVIGTTSFYLALFFLFRKNDRPLDEPTVGNLKAAVSRAEFRRLFSQPYRPRFRPFS